MKIFKQTDLAIQLILLVLSIIYWLASGDFIHAGTSFLFGWQIISCLLHILLKHKYYSLPERINYNRTLLFLFILGLSTFPFWEYYLFILIVTYAYLLIFLFLTIWYMVICHAEYRLLKHKEFIHLK
jgi:hypothetical protein